MERAERAEKAEKTMEGAEEKGGRKDGIEQSENAKKRTKT